MTNQALKKIDMELKSFKGDKYSDIIKDRCAEVLKNFCKQDEEFAQAVVQTDKTFTNCMAAVVKKISGNKGISDLDAFKEIVNFYFPGAGINFTMTIDLCASVQRDITVSQSTASAPAQQEEKQPERASQPAKKKSVLNISFDDLFR